MNHLSEQMFSSHLNREQASFPETQHSTCAPVVCPHLASFKALWVFLLLTFVHKLPCNQHPGSPNALAQSVAWKSVCFVELEALTMAADCKYQASFFLPDALQPLLT